MLKSIMNYYQRREKRLQLRLDSEDSPEGAYRCRRAIRRNRASLNSIEGFFRTDAGGSQENWVTINGTHVLIDENGVAQSGGKLKGASFKNAKSTPSKKSSQSSASAENTPKAPQPKGNYHVPVSKADSKALQKYGVRNDKETTIIEQTHTGGDQEVKRLYGEGQMTTLEFAQKSREAVESWSDEDKLLDAAYTGADRKISMHTDYEELNRKLREGEKLSDEEQAVVDHFSRCAKPLGKDTDLYRMVNSNYVQSLFSSTGALSLEDLAGKTVTNSALQSTCVGVNTFFDRNDVAIKIKAPSNMPVCLTSDVSEGEIVIPAGARMRITSARTVHKPTWETSKGSDGRMKVTVLSEGEILPLPKWESVRGLRNAGCRSEDIAPDCGFAVRLYSKNRSPTKEFRGTYIEMEIVGYEQ